MPMFSKMLLLASMGTSLGYSTSVAAGDKSKSTRVAMATSEDSWDLEDEPSVESPIQIKQKRRKNKGSIESNARSSKALVAGALGARIFGPVAGAEVFATPARWAHIGLQVTGGSGELKAEDQQSNSSDDKNATYEYISFNYVETSLKGRFFAGNSFYLSPALAYGTAKGRWGLSNPKLESRSTVDYRSDLLITSLGIGNLWHKSPTGFFVGVEWITLNVIAQQKTEITSDSIALESTATNSTILEVPLGDAGKDEFSQRVSKALEKSLQFRALTTSLGWIF